MSLVTENLLRDLLTEMYRLHPAARLCSHWVMDAATWRNVQPLRDSTGLPIAYPIIGSQWAWTLLGKRVKIQDDVEGYHLTPDP